MSDFLPKTFPVYLSVKVIPNKPTTQIVEIMGDGTVKIELSAQPEKGKANQELQKFFKKNFEILCTVKTGSTQRKKLLYLEKN